MPEEEEESPVLPLETQSLFNPNQQAEEYERYAQEEFARVPTGYKCLDDNVLRGGGLAPGDVMMVVARSEVGKSFYLQNLLRHIASNGTPVLDISLEMTVAQKFQRMACIHWDLDPTLFEEEVKRGGPAAYDYLDQYEKDFPKLVVYKPRKRDGATWEAFDRAMDRYVKAYGEKPRVVAIDFLGLVAGDRFDGKSGDSIPKNAQRAESWADAHEVSLLLLHQTGRANEGNPMKRNHGHIPLTMEDLMYGGEQNADYIIGLYRPDREPPPDKPRNSDEYREWEQRVHAERNNVYVQVLKNRHGPRTIESQYPGFRHKQHWPSGLLTENAPSAPQYLHGPQVNPLPVVPLIGDVPDEETA